MSERKYYVFCEDNCRFEGMTKEEIFEAIAEATGATPVHVDDAFITKIKEKNKNAALTFWLGTRAQYNAIQTKDPKCFYIISDEPYTNLSEDVEALKLDNATLMAEHDRKGVVLYDGTDDNIVGQTIEDIDKYKVVSVEKLGGAVCTVTFSGQNYYIYGAGGAVGNVLDMDKPCMIIVKIRCDANGVVIANDTLFYDPSNTESPISAIPNPKIIGIA